MDDTLSNDQIARAVRAAFELLAEQGVAYCVAGRTELLPDHPESDIDIIVGAADMARVSDLMRAVAERVDGRIVQCLRHERGAWYYVVAMAGGEGCPRYLTLDWCGDYVRRGRLLLSAEDMLRDRRMAQDAHGTDRCFLVAAPQMEFIYYLLKKIDKRSLSEVQGAHLSDAFALAPEAAQKQLFRFFSARSRQQLTDAAASGDWAPVRSKLALLQREIHRAARRSSVRGWVGDTQRMIFRLRHPTGLHVVILGPDGSGKSTVATHLAPCVAPMFRHVREYHLFPSTPKNRGGSTPVTDPHGSPARGWGSSIAKIVVWQGRYLLGWLTTLYPAKVRSTLLLFDRYYHDLLIDPRRYRFRGPMRLARWVGRMVPAPDLWLVLDAPPQILQRRKQEVPPAETARQSEAYRQLAARLRNAHIIDATQPLERVVAAAADAIVTCMERRTGARRAP